MSTALLQLNIRRPVVRDVATLIAIVGYGVAWRLFQITQPFVDSWCWRESDVAMIAENFYRNGYNILWLFRVLSGRRSQIEFPTVEVDGVDEVLLIAETARRGLDPLNP